MEFDAALEETKPMQTQEAGDRLSEGKRMKGARLSRRPGEPVVGGVMGNHMLLEHRLQRARLHKEPRVNCQDSGSIQKRQRREARTQTECAFQGK